MKEQTIFRTVHRQTQNKRSSFLFLSDVVVSLSQRGAQRHTTSHNPFKASSWKTIHVRITYLTYRFTFEIFKIRFNSPKPGYRRLGMTLRLHKNSWRGLRASLSKLTKKSNFSQVTNPCPTKHRIGTGLSKYAFRRK